MIYSLLALSLFSGIVAALFLGVAAYFYMHVPVKVRVKSRRDHRNN